MMWHSEKFVKRRGCAARALCCVPVLLLLCAPQMFAAEYVPPEKKYLAEKSAGNYRAALDILLQWTESIDDPALAEINVFRIRELVYHPELAGAALDGLNKILSADNAASRTPGARDRIMLLKNRLLLSRGDISAARAVLGALGVVQSYTIIGPFANEGIGDFEISHAPEHAAPDGERYPGKLHPVHWFETRPNHYGAVDINELMLPASAGLYYFSADISIHEKGLYTVHLGKTGYTDIWLDGGLIFRNRRRHSFCEDQYALNVYMTEGRHRLLVKTGDSTSGGIRFFMRIAAADTADPAAGPSGVKVAAPAMPSDRVFFRPLNALVRRGPLSPRESFLAGYLYFSSGLSSEEARESADYFSSARGDPEWAAAACFYLGAMESGSEEKEFYLKKAAESGGRLESLEQIALLKLRGGFTYEAASVIEQMKRLHAGSPAVRGAEAELCMRLGWYDEALRISHDLIQSGFPSAGYAIDAGVAVARSRYARAAESYEKVYEADRGSESHALALVGCYEKAGDLAKARWTLEGALASFPASALVRIRLANCVKNHAGNDAAFPYFMSVLAVSPYEENALINIGMAYHISGRDELALQYFQRAMLYNPNNFQIKHYIQILKNESDYLDEFAVKGDAMMLANAASNYRDEAAVIVLDECGIKLAADGSCEKAVRKIIKINDEEAIDDFSRQYVVFNPFSDRVRELRCTVINGGRAIDAVESYTQSLSDPESRMYYDIHAKVIAVPALQKGSIIELRYRIRSVDPDIRRGYYGERITAGSEYRTLKANYSIGWPEHMTMYCYTKNFGVAKARKIRSGGNIVTRIELENIPPHKKEAAMPGQADFLPGVIVSTHRDWRSMHRWYAALVKDRIVLDGGMRNALSSIVGAHDEPLEKVRKIFTHINDSIRYVGFELGMGGIVPRRADITYASKMGDCKDITLVLVAMLRAAGIDARVALLRTRDRGAFDESIPFLGQFNHAVCYVNYKGGFFLDATAKMSGFLELPSDDRDVAAFVFDERGYKFIRTTGSLYVHNSDTTDTTIVLNPDGGAAIVRMLVKEGSFARRARYELIDADGKLAQIGGFWNERFKGATVSGLTVISRDYDSPVRYSYRVNIPSFYSTTGNDVIIMKSFISQSDYYKEYAMIRERNFPLVLSGLWVTGETIAYHIPAGMTVTRLPKSEKRSYKKYEASFEYLLQGNVILVRSRLSFRDYMITPEEYAQFRDFALFVSRKENERIILQVTKKKTTGAKGANDRLAD